MKIFVGWDSREAIACEVCLKSIKNFSPDADARFLKLSDPDVKECFDRPWHKEHNQYIDDQTGTPFSTEFSFSRFIVPHLMNYQGWALFCDGDFLFRADLERLFAYADDKYAMMCVHHNHVVKPLHPGKKAQMGERRKMDGVMQLAYERKNWSSLMLWNCGHPSNSRLSPLLAATMPGRALHTFFWLQKEEIGEIPEEWNWLSGVSPTTPAGREINPRAQVKAVHFTEGGPWFDGYQDTPFGDEWLSVGGWKTQRLFSAEMRRHGVTAQARNHREYDRRRKKLMA